MSTPPAEPETPHPDEPRPPHEAEPTRRSTEESGESESEEEEEDMMMMASDVEMPSIFSTRRPCHFGSGLSSGLKSIAKGVGLGLTTLVAAPVVGAAEGGVVGFFKGLGIGVVGGVALPVGGVIIGTAQVARGALNTPTAVYSASKGKHWDRYEREWVAYRPDRALVLDTPEFDNVAGKGREEEGATGKGGRGDEDDLYERLGVSREASDSEIRKQYYRRARELHPDKNPDEPEAQARFQKLGQAYQILSNPDQRAHYDATGDVDAAAEDDLVDSSLFFTMLFGSDKFDHIVGQLAMAAAASMGEQASERLFARAQLYRLIALAHGLRQRLDAARLGRVPDASRAPRPLVPLALNEDEFVARAREEAKLLAAASFGSRMLMAVSRAYRTGARVAAGGLGGLAARVAGSAHSLRLQAGAVSTIFGVANAQHRAQRRLHSETQAERRRRDGRRFDQEFQTQETSKEDGNYVVVTKRSEDGEGGTEATEAGGARAPTPRAEPQASTAQAPQNAAGTEGKAAIDEKPDTGKGASGAHGQTEEGGEAGGGTVDSNEEDEEFARRMERELEREALPHMLKAMWAANEIDVAQTLRQVTRLAVVGGSHGLDKATKEERKGRALLLAKLSQTYMETAAEAAAQEESAEDQMERAAHATAAARSARYFHDDVDVDQLHRETERQRAADADDMETAADADDI